MSAGSGNAATMLLRGTYNSGVSRSSLVFAAACLAVVLYALVPACTRLAGVQLDGLSIGFIRAVGAGILAAPALVICRVLPPSDTKGFTLLLVYALGNFAGFPILFSLGAQRTAGTHAALIMATMPLLIGSIGIALNRSMPRWSWFVGMATAGTSEVVLVGSGHFGTTAGATITGDAIVFAGCALSAIGLVAGARLGSRMKPLAGAAWAMTIGAIVLAPFAVAHVLTAPYRYSNLTWMTWLALAQITLGAAVVANILLVWALSKGGIVRIAPLQFAQPLCAVFFASALLNEPLTLSLLFLAAAIVLGIVTASRGAQLRLTAGEPVLSVIERVRSIARFLSPIFFEQEEGLEGIEWKPDATPRQPTLPSAMPLTKGTKGEADWAWL